MEAIGPRPAPKWQKPGTRQRRTLFTAEEDARLVRLVEEFGENAWLQIADNLSSRTSRQCKERYCTYLCPKVNRLPWSRDEDELLRQKVRECGQRWAEIAKFFDGRPPNLIKNRWHMQMRARAGKETPVKTVQFQGELVHQSQNQEPRRIVFPSVLSLPFPGS
jgi:hypothetical protein